MSVIINHDKEKLYNAIIYFIDNTNNCGKTKLYKLLSLLDFNHFKETGTSVTGLKYKAFEKGPFPYELDRKIDSKYNFDVSNNELLDYIDINFDGTQYFLKSKKEFNNKLFTKRELNLLEYLATKYKYKTAQQLIKLTHRKDTPWTKTVEQKGENSIIDYKITLKKKNKKELESKIDERELIEAIFNGTRSSFLS